MSGMVGVDRQIDFFYARWKSLICNITSVLLYFFVIKKKTRLFNALLFFFNLMDNHSIVKQSLNDKLAGRVMGTEKIDKVAAN